MLEIVGRLFESDSFMPHGHCYLWRPDILWLNVGSDAVIAAAYFAIPAFLVYFVKKREDLAFNWIFVMFALFILACGTTHIFEIWTVWNPEYGTQGIVKLFTAGVWVATALALAPLMPKALALPSARELEEGNRIQQHLNEELRLVNASLESRVLERTEAVKKNEERFRRVIEAAPNGLLMIDREGKIVLCNTEFESQFGYSREEIVGKEMEFLVPKRYRTNHKPRYYSSRPQATEG